MKKSISAFVAGLFATMFFTFTTVNAQTPVETQTGFYKVGGYLYDSQTDTHWDMSTRNIGSLPSSNPASGGFSLGNLSGDPNKPYRDAYNQAVAYNTPDKWYREGYDYHQPVQQVVVQPQPQQQPQPGVKATVAITCYFMTQDKSKLIAVGGTYNTTTHVFEPGLANYWTGSTWSGYQLTKDPFTELGFCGGFLPVNGVDTWYSSEDKSVWNTSRYPAIYHGYASQAPVVNGAVQIL